MVNNGLGRGPLAALHSAPREVPRALGVALSAGPDRDIAHGFAAALDDS